MTITLNETNKGNFITLFVQIYGELPAKDEQLTRLSILMNTDLTEQEEAILAFRYSLHDGDEMKTPAEVCDFYGITLEEARQSEKRAILKLRHPVRMRRVYGINDEKKEIDLSSSLLDVNFSLRTCRILKRKNILTVGDLIKANTLDVFSSKTLGHKSSLEIVTFINTNADKLYKLLKQNEVLNANN